MSLYFSHFSSSYVCLSSLSLDYLILFFALSEFSVHLVFTRAQQSIVVVEFISVLVVVLFVRLVVFLLIFPSRSEYVHFMFLSKQVSNSHIRTQSGTTSLCTIYVLRSLSSNHGETRRCTQHAIVARSRYLLLHNYINYILNIHAYMLGKSTLSSSSSLFSSVLVYSFLLLFISFFLSCFVLVFCFVLNVLFFVRNVRAHTRVS